MATTRDSDKTRPCRNVSPVPPSELVCIVETYTHINSPQQQLGREQATSKELAICSNHFYRPPSSTASQMNVNDTPSRMQAPTHPLTLSSPPPEQNNRSKQWRRWFNFIHQHTIAIQLDYICKSAGLGNRWGRGVCTQCGVQWVDIKTTRRFISCTCYLSIWHGLLPVESWWWCCCRFMHIQVAGTIVLFLFFLYRSMVVKPEAEEMSCEIWKTGSW